jgi:translation initiation factor IF-3
MVGIVDVEEAKRLAREAGLDLVEVAPDSDPPVCRIRDYGKYKYELSKKDKANRQKSKSTETKEVRLGRSMKIDPHDIQIRLNQARRFLMEGHKVQIVQNFRGREMVHRDRGDERMKAIIDQLADISKVEMSPRLTHRRMTMLLAPDKAKIEQIKRREAQVGGSAGGTGQPARREEAEPSPPAPEPDSDAPERTESDAASKGSGSRGSESQATSESRNEPAEASRV